MSYQYTIRGFTYRFDDLLELLAKASPLRSGDVLADWPLLPTKSV